MSSVEEPVAPASEAGRPWTLADLAGPPTCFAVLPDGSIATGSTTGPVLLRSSRGDLLGRLDGHDGPVTALVALSSREIASAGGDGTVRLWSLPSATSTLATRHDGAVTALALTRRELASAGADGTIRTWPLRDGAPRLIAESRAPMTALTVTTDGWFIGGDGEGRLWACHPDEGADEPLDAGHAEGGIQALVALPGRVLASAARSRIRLWDLDSDAPAEVLEGHEGQVEALLAQENGMLVSAANDGTVRQWDVQGRAHRIGTVTGTELASPPSPVRALATLATGSLTALGEDGVVYSWFGRVVTPSLAHPSPPVEALVATSDGLLASASPASVSFWDPDTGVRLHQTPLDAAAHLGQPRLLAAAPEGRVVSAAGTVVQVWGPGDGLAVSSWDLPDPVVALTVADDGRVLAADATGMVHTRFLGSDGGLADAASFSVGLSAAALAAWPKLAAAVDAGATIRAIDLGEDFRRLPTVEGGGGLRAATGAGDERLAVAHGTDGVTIYDVRGGEEQAWLRTGGSEVTAMAQGWHHDLAVATNDGLVRLWPATNDSLATHVDPWVVEAHPQEVSTVAVLPDGEMVATGGDDGTIRLRTVGTGADVTPEADGQHRTIVLPGLAVAAMAGDGAAHEDRLGFASHTEALARVLASKKTSPPMAVALLGDWGAGKSSFMAQLEQKLEEVAASRRGSPEDPFCSRLLHVRFNAWQYADTHLWSGLAAGLFEQLHRAVPGGNAREADEQAQLRRELVVEERHLVEVDQEIDEVELASARLERVPAVLRDHTAARRLAGIAADQELRTLPGLRRAASALRRRRWLAWGGAVVGLVVLAAVLKGDTVARWLAVVPGVVSASLVTAGAVLQSWSQKLTKVHDRLAGVLGGEDPGPTDARLVALYERRSTILDRRDALRDLLGESEPEVRLARFLAAKAESADYVPYRGLLDFVRRDLDALRDHLDDDCRVVVYVDDLDRCDPQRVVDLLAAVHLMVAYPHVIVIVAVDARWLLTSLRLHYRELLALDESAGLAGFDATPSEYLEKIFQFAYAVPRPSNDLVPYLAELLPVEPTPDQRQPDPAIGPSNPPSTTRTTSRGPDVGVVGPEAGLGAGPSAQTMDKTEVRPDTDAGVVEPGEATPNERPPVGAASRTGAYDPATGGSPDGWDAPPPVDDVVVRAEERDYVATLAPLLGTPRTVKRLANVYRVLRARIPAAELDGYLQRGEYGAVLLLLAVVLGRPLAAPAVFERLQRAAALGADVRAALSPAGSARPTSDGDAAGSTRPEVAPDSLPIADVERTLADLGDVELACADPRSYARWLPEVARYSFRYRELLAAIERARGSAPGG